MGQVIEPIGPTDTGMPVGAVSPHGLTTVTGIDETTGASLANPLPTTAVVTVSPSDLQIAITAAVKAAFGATVIKPINTAALTVETALWTPAGGKKFVVKYISLASSLGGVLTFNDGMAGSLLTALSVDGTQRPSEESFGSGKESVSADHALTVIAPSGATLSGVIWGDEV